MGKNYCYANKTGGRSYPNNRTRKQREESYLSYGGQLMTLPEINATCKPHDNTKPTPKPALLQPKGNYNAKKIRDLRS